MEMYANENTSRNIQGLRCKRIDYTRATTTLIITIMAVTTTNTTATATTTSTITTNMFYY